jgi:hypothetical protein
MKNNFYLQKKAGTASAILAIALIIFACACKTKNDNLTGTVYIHMHTNIDTNEVADATTLYNDGTGRHFSLSTGQFYLSDIGLHNVNGTTYKFNGTYILKTIGTEQYLVGLAPVGTYDYVSFNVGVAASDNSTAPSGFASTHPLNNTDMWFGNTTQGFMFMKIEGLADTTAGQTGTSLVHLSYQIGSASNLKTVTMPARTGTIKPYVVISGATEYVHLVCDYGKLLAGVDFKTQNNTNTYTTNPTLAGQIANNIAGMFDYEE